MPPTLDKMITAERKAHPAEDPDRLVARLWTLLSEQGQAPPVLYPAFRDYVLNNARSHVRTIERRLFNAATDQIAVDAREQLLSEGFPLAGGWVRWADATVAQLEARIDELEAQRDELDTTIAFYRSRLEEMRAAGVRRWGDLAKRRRRPRAS